MKVIYRIPTEQYAYVEIRREYEVEPTIEDIQHTNSHLLKAFRVQVGLPTKDFNACLDRYLNDGTGDTEKYLAMSPQQQAVIQEIKKAFKRMEAKGSGQVEAAGNSTS